MAFRFLRPARGAPASADGAPNPTVRERLAALRYVPAMLRLVWETHRGYAVTMGALRVARAGNITSVQKTLVLTEVAKLHAKTEPGRAIELLDEALAEVKRIDQSSPDRVRALVSVATQLVELDRPRAWEVMLDIVKAANDAEAFTGEDGRITVRLQTKNMTNTSSSSVQSFDLAGIFTDLAREDLTRATSLARDFKGESPRAVATLAVARAVLEKK
jgi:hypothetical protein